MTTYNYKGIKVQASSKKEAIRHILSISKGNKVTASLSDLQINADDYEHNDVHKINGIDFNKLKRLIIDVGLVNEQPENCSPSTDEYCTYFLNEHEEFQKAILNKDREALKKFVKFIKEANSWDGTYVPVCSKNTNFVVEDILSHYYLNKPYKIKVTPEMKKKWMEKAMSEACRIAKVDDVGQLSDGYHTFDDLYWQRCVLFAKLVEIFKDKAWKTKRHDDGELCFGDGHMFLVCIDTPQGTYSYHYPMKDWDMFKCKELYKAKPFDGHTSKDVERILSL